MKACYIPHPMFPGRMPNGVPSFELIERESLRRELRIQRMENDFLRREVEMLREELKKHGQYPFPPSSWDVYCNTGQREDQG